MSLVIGFIYKVTIRLLFIQSVPGWLNWYNACLMETDVLSACWVKVTWPDWKVLREMCWIMMPSPWIMSGFVAFQRL